MWICSAAGDRAWRRFHPEEVETDPTVADKGTPSWLGPEYPVNLIRGPKGDQSSNQKLPVRPFPILHLIYCSANGLSFRIDFQIQEDCLDSSILHKLDPWRRWVLVQLAQRDSVSEKRSHTSFKHRVLFHVIRSLSLDLLQILEHIMTSMRPLRLPFL